MIASHLNRIRASLQYIIIGSLGALLCAQAVVSTKWRMEHDTPLLHYAAFLMDEHGRFPYRDIFETSMPGTFAFHYAVVKLFGDGDGAFRSVDLALLCLLLAATYVFMRRFGRPAGLAASVTFGLLYLSKGQTMSLQRDYIGLIPVACSLLCLPADTERTVSSARFAVAGLLFGAAATIKPHLAIGLPVIFGTLVAFRWGRRGKSLRDFLMCGAVCGLSFLLPAVLAVLWLWKNSALADFAAMFFNYLPLHVSLTGAQEDLSGFDRVFYLVEQTLQFGGYGALVLCALFAGYRVAARSGQKRETMLSCVAVFLCALAYTIYPALGGKFWDYHFLPLAYFLCAACSLLLSDTTPVRREDVASESRVLLLPVIFLAAICVQLNLPRYFVAALRGLRTGRVASAPNGGRVDEIAAWLKRRAGPSDTVQPLDWANGAIHAMLLSRTRLATEFMYEYHFYHHVSSPVIQNLRREFIEQLRQSAPRFIVETRINKPWIPGGDPAMSFPELRQYVTANYVVAAEGNGYVIYERTQQPGDPPQQNSGQGDSAGTVVEPRR